MTDPRHRVRSRAGEAGFTLVEALVSIVVLVFGLIAITNLLLVAASSNTVGNVGTAATTIASERMEILKAQSFEVLAGALGANASIGGLTSDVSSGCTIGAAMAGPCFRDDLVPGVGNIHTRVMLAPGLRRSDGTPDPQSIFITVRSEGTAPLTRARSRSEFTTFRTCTDIRRGCPNP